MAVLARHALYFDSRRDSLDVEHVMASGALPPGLPAVRCGAGRGRALWDGGLYSNTPLEAVRDDDPRRDSLIFSVNVWQPTGHEPASIGQAMARQLRAGSRNCCRTDGRRRSRLPDIVAAGSVGCPDASR